MTGTKPRTSVESPYPVVQFHGMPGSNASHSLHTNPLHGLWYVGEAPEWALRQGIECYGTREFSPGFCRQYNRQCGQLGSPCKAGDDCTCWAYQFTATWNAGTEKRGKTITPPFDVIEPNPAPVPEPETTPALVPEADSTADKE